MTPATDAVALPDIGHEIDEAALARLPVVGPQLAAIRELSAAFGIDRLEVFGSVATSKFASDSDIDFIVYYPVDYDFGPVIKRYFDFQAALAGVLARPVDLVMANSVRSPRFALYATATRHLIYER